MKHLKRLCKVMALMMVLTILSPSILPFHTTAVAEAATVKLNKKKLTLVVGKSATLQITGTKAKVTWTSSDKKVATVTGSGKVTGKKEGKATITATVNKKKYSCAVTVKKPAVSFKTQEALLGKIKIKYPENWTNTVLSEDGNNVMSMLYPNSVDMATGTSNISLVITETGVPKPDFEEAKKTLESNYTAEDLVEQLNLGVDVTISEIKTSEFKAALGSALVMEYTLSFSVQGMEGTMAQVIYALPIDNYLIVLITTDIGDGKALGLKDIAEYMVNSIAVVE